MTTDNSPASNPDGITPDTTPTSPDTTQTAPDAMPTTEVPPTKTSAPGAPASMESAPATSTSAAETAQELRDPATPAPAAVQTQRPRVRWAGIIWGVVFISVASMALWVMLDDGRRAAVTDWLWRQNAVSTAAWTILLLGALALFSAMVGVAGYLQRRGRRQL